MSEASKLDMALFARTSAACRGDDPEGIKVIKGTLVAGLVLSLAACNLVNPIKANDKCPHPGEHRLQENVTDRCDVIPGEMQKNFFGKEFPVSRWVKLE